MQFCISGNDTHPTDLLFPELNSTRTIKNPASCVLVKAYTSPAFSVCLGLIRILYPMVRCSATGVRGIMILLV